MKKLLLLFIPIFIMIFGVKGYAESYSLEFASTNITLEIGEEVTPKIPTARVVDSAGNAMPYTYIKYTYGYLGNSIDSIDVSRVGTYGLYVTAEAQNYSITKREYITFNVVDNTPPTIHANDIIERGYYETCDLLDYVKSVTDNVDTPYYLEYECEYDQNILGDYLVTFKATDVSGNVGEKTSVLRIVDDKAPDIDVPDEIILNYGDEFKIEDYVKVLDEYDLSKDYTVSEFTTDSLGYQQIEITASDTLNNTATKLIDFTIYDLECPKIKLKENLKIAQNEDFSTCIESVSDNYDALSIDEVNITYEKFGNGVFKVYYSLKDSSLNECKIHEFITIEYENKPVIEAINLDNITDPFDPYNYVKAYDKEDGDITDRVYLIEANYDEKYCIFEVYDNDGNIVRSKIDLASTNELDTYNGILENNKVVFPEEANDGDIAQIKELNPQNETNKNNYIFIICLGVGIILLITFIIILIRHFKKKMI